MKRWCDLPVLILICSLLLPSDPAAAAERYVTADGVYQVELSFQSEESANQDLLFSKDAELLVKDGHFSLSVWTDYQDVIKKISVKQSAKKLPSLWNDKENLVQFDIPDIQETFLMEGMFQWSADDLMLPFSQEVVINSASLPQSKPTAAPADSQMPAGPAPASQKPSPKKPDENKTTAVKNKEERQYTPRPSRHSKEAAAAREKQQAAEKQSVLPEDEQLVFDRKQDEPAKQRPMELRKEQTAVQPAVAQVAGEIKAPPALQTAAGAAPSFELAKVSVLLLACLLSGVLLIRRLIRRKKEIISE